MRSSCTRTAVIAPAEGTGRESRALAAALLPFLALSVVDGLYKARLHALSPLAFWAADAVKFVVVPALSLWLLARLARIGPARYGLALPVHQAPATLAAETLVACVLLWACYWFAQRVAEMVLPGPPPGGFGYEDSLPQAGLGRAAGTLYLAATAAFAEEALLRGVLRAWVERVVAPARAAGVFMGLSALLFASLHWESGAAALGSTGLYGLTAAWLYLRQGSLWPLVAAHFLIDLVAFR